MIYRGRVAEVDSGTFEAVQASEKGADMPLSGSISPSGGGLTPIPRAIMAVFR